MIQDAEAYIKHILERYGIAHFKTYFRRYSVQRNIFQDVIIHAKTYMMPLWHTIHVSQRHSLNIIIIVTHYKHVCGTMIFYKTPFMTP